MAKKRKKMNVKFEKTDKVKCDNGIYECIVADDEIAVFAEITSVYPFEEEKRVSHEELFTVSNKTNEAFERVDFVGICEKCGYYIWSDQENVYDSEDDFYLHKKCI